MYLQQTLHPSAVVMLREIRKSPKTPTLSSKCCKIKNECRLTFDYKSSPKSPGCSHWHGPSEAGPYVLPTLRLNSQKQLWRTQQDLIKKCKNKVIAGFNLKFTQFIHGPRESKLTLIIEVLTEPI